MVISIQLKVGFLSSVTFKISFLSYFEIYDPQNLIDKIVSYIIHIRRIQKQHAYKADNIIATDDMVSVTAAMEMVENGNQ